MRKVSDIATDGLSTLIGDQQTVKSFHITRVKYGFKGTKD